MRIVSVVARQLLDCKARPLVEVEIATDTGHVGRGASPTGSSVGVHEAFVLRDGDRAEYNGLSVHRAVSAGRSVPVGERRELGVGGALPCRARHR